MKKKNLNWFKAILFGCAMLLFSACEDSNDVVGTGEAEFEITDSPSDDAAVKGVFVTIADIKVDGKSVSGFSKQTIDLKAYQDGKTKLLGTTSLDAKTYNTLTLVLDAGADASDNAPGCYVQTTDDVKYKLSNTATGQLEVIINNTWKVSNGVKSKFIIDFDLRKSIRRSDDPSVRYTFVSDNDLHSSVRLITHSNAGSIEGSYEDQAGSGMEKVIVYAYKKGAFNASAEIQPQSEDGIVFKNAIASAEVRAKLTGNVYTFAFLEEGEYELHFAGYKEDSGTGRFAFQSMLESETTVDGSVDNVVTIEGGIKIAITSKIIGML